jgi:hypothetical protein
MNELDSVLALNGVSVLGVRGNMIEITQYEKKICIPNNAESDKNAPDIKEILLEFKGKRNCIIYSDVFGVENEKVKVKNLEMHNIKRIMNKVIEKSIPFMSKICAEEESNILIQTIYEKENPALTITVGLMDDVQVLLLDIHYERNERRISC